LAPSGARARFDANVTAVLLSRRLGEERRPATSQEQQLLARWSSWGALADLFDEAKPEWSAERARLRELFDEDAWRAAERTTINACRRRVNTDPEATFES
jgi:hypothetical protein